MLIFLGADANVTFEANIGDFTGPVVFERPGGASHLGRTRGVQYWLQSLGLRAANTFGSSEISDSWTWGRGMKKKNSRRQLDYVLVSNYITGFAAPSTHLKNVLNKSDHRPVSGEFDVGNGIDSICRTKTSIFPFTGWEPENGEAAEVFQSQIHETIVVDNRFSDLSLELVERGCTGE